MNETFAFLKSNRFWVLVAASFTITAEGNFTEASIYKALITFFTGFIAIRTLDRGAEYLSGRK